MDYFDQNLTIGTIPKSGRYTVFGVNWQTGRIFPTKQYLTKGTWVFALRDGRPVLKGLCGNPLIVPYQPKQQPPEEVKKPPLSPPTPASFFPPPPGTETAGEFAEAEEVPSETVPTMEGVLPFQGAAPLAHRSRMLPLFFPWHHGGGGGERHEVPEPGTNLLVAAGLTLLVLLRRRQRA